MFSGHDGFIVQGAKNANRAYNVVLSHVDSIQRFSSD